MRKLMILFAATVLLSSVGACSKNATQATLKVQGVCEMCKDRIEKAAKSVEGVSEASWNVETKELQLSFDASKTSLEAVSQAIAKAGHDTEKDKASDEAYDALPGCCKYRG
jgi:Cu(I)/Ag(I) efflux system membrane fusion protein